ncbi:pentatricopeptide repeat-containing protein At1g43980, mitochondrial [Humulus lupulus]|uniref:pentatricopeptide repeat-containing protein At1g43980, mitochondrial n=1 Tax=Humulus lupulus TaxID=3486 RepID=UPI002B409BB0|nr:pentatricopeptide repeat-containing protein At1g43980, mitochondrial [Humulus lupulus]
MHPILRQVNGRHRTSLSYYTYILDRCWTIKSLNFVKITHAQLIKVGFNTHTFLGNRSLDIYCQCGTVDDALKVFDDIVHKNCISWNICLKGLFRHGCLERARMLFDQMTLRDVVTWNSMISGYLSYGLIGYALVLYLKMQNAGVRPNQYTFSILVSLASCAHQGKQIHGSIIRNAFNLSNVVLGNSLISMYGKLGHVDYAYGVFLTMVKVDAISWNSLIWSCHQSGYGELALDQFYLMRTTQHVPDQFTMSTVISICCIMRDLDKGKQIFAFCCKVGFLSNSIVLSAAIDLLSKCNRLEDAVQLFNELNNLELAVCNSMISSYAGHGFGEKAIKLFVLMLKENLRPTEFTFSSILSSVSGILPADQGSQIHSFVVKMGVESDAIVSCSLVQMYSKVGLIDYAMKVFVNMTEKDLVSWNTIIIGLTHNGYVFKALDIFKELVIEGPHPDHITLLGVLLACNYGNLVDEGMEIFSCMEQEYGIIPECEHYLCIIDLLSGVGKLKEAMNIIAEVPFEPSFMLWRAVLRCSDICADLKLVESVAERMMEIKPKSSLPYLVLARAYEIRGRWESVIRIREAMKRHCMNDMIECSWLGIKNHVYTFKADQLLHHGGEDIYIILKLLFWQLEVGYI